MENREFFNRIDDLRDRAARRGLLTHTPFLTPAEQYALSSYYRGGDMVLFGGQQGCERQAAFFLPEYMDLSAFDAAEYLRAIQIEAHFGTPGHRDYLGAMLGLGLNREALGDVRIEGDTAWVFCLPPAAALLLEELHKVGRLGVKVTPCALEQVPPPLLQVKKLSFSVKSLRLDAVLSALFGISRTAAAEQIRLGNATLNYAPCLRPDAPVQPGDVLSLRGHGKGRIVALGNRSRKDRQFVEGEVLV